MFSEVVHGVESLRNTGSSHLGVKLREGLVKLRGGCASKLDSWL